MLILLPQSWSTVHIHSACHNGEAKMTAQSARGMCSVEPRLVIMQKRIRSQGRAGQVVIATELDACCNFFCPLTITVTLCTRYLWDVSRASSSATSLSCPWPPTSDQPQRRAAGCPNYDQNHFFKLSTVTKAASPYQLKPLLWYQDDLTLNQPLLIVSCPILTRRGSREGH